MATNGSPMERYVEEIAKSMAAEGHEVVVYLQKENAPKTAQMRHGITIVRIPNIGKGEFALFLHSLFSVLHSLFKKYDVVHFQTKRSASLAWIIRVLKPNVATVVTIHKKDDASFEESSLSKFFSKIAEYLACVAPQGIIVFSKENKKEILGKYGARASFIPVVLGVKKFKDLEISKKWNIRSKRYALFAGEIIRSNGIHYLIEAFKQLEDTSKLPNNFKLVIIGDWSDDEDKEYIEYLREISKDRDNIILVRNKFKNILKEVLSQAYVYISPSESEDQTMPVFEAMSYGLPVIASDIKENKELLKDAAIYFNSGNIQDLRDKMAFLLNRPDKAQEAGELIRKFIDHEYGWHNTTKKTLEEYESIIKVNREKHE